MNAVTRLGISPRAPSSRLAAWAVVAPFLLAQLSLPATAAQGTAQPVTCREVDEVIPTYLSGPPSADPMFYFGSQSQGAEGRIYPYPLYNNLTNHKADQTYRLVYLENEYVRIAIAPQIGGRLLSAVDKTNQYDFVYHQHVIKPALIGLIGAWISGGIEWNIPHHHRASTFLPVQYRTVANADGSWTVWVGELEIRHRMRWAVGYTVEPGSSVLRCSVRILNRTPLAESMLCFANLAVNADKDYQIIFPPSTQFVAHHLKRQFTTWPIATTTYGGVDWNGVDASWYRNHMAANSMFAWNSPEDFFAGYDHGRQAGTMSVADHHTVPGKKFWTWGNGPHGRMWDSILTDTDGPYLELMVGAYSDNQPDYSWMQPFETRSFEMNWYPFRGIDGVKNANLDAAVNLEVKDGSAHFGFYTTRQHSGAHAQLLVAGRRFVDDTIDIGPASPYTNQVALPDNTAAKDVRASLVSDGRELVSYSPITLVPEPMPTVVTPPEAPQSIATNEELDLAGQRIEQFHDPLHQAEPYWLEVLRRDPGDTVAHFNLGIVDLRAARFEKAEDHFRRANARLTAKYTSPKDTEPFYYLGLALRGEGRDAEAFDAFYKASWSQEWRAPAFYSLAELASARGEFAKALNFVGQSMDANALDVRAYGLESSILRHLGREADAQAVLLVAQERTDPLDVRLMAERWLAAPDESSANLLFSTLDSHIATAQELASEFGNAGLWTDGFNVLSAAVGRHGGSSRSPIVLYYLGDFAERTGHGALAAEFRRQAEAMPPDYGFPFQAELIPVLRRAIAANPADPRAPYYLGNLLFDWQPEQAIALWEQSRSLDPSYPVVWRNLAQAYAHSGDDAGRTKAIAALEKAVALSDRYPAHFSELDSLYAAAGEQVGKRLDLLEKHRAAIVNDDESLARLISLETFAGKSEDAIDLLSGHTFNIWEGGTQFDTGAMWIDAHITHGREMLAAGKPDSALAAFRSALMFPQNLRALPWDGVGSRSIEVSYWTGLALQASGQADKAEEAWKSAASATVPRSLRRNDANASFDRGVQQYYQALAMRRLGRSDDAQKVFRGLVDSAATKETAPGPEASRPTLASRARAADGHFLSGIGHAGLGEQAAAYSEFQAALAVCPDHLGAKMAMSETPKP